MDQTQTMMRGVGADSYGRSVLRSTADQVERAMPGLTTMPSVAALREQPFPADEGLRDRPAVARALDQADEALHDLAQTARGLNDRLADARDRLEL
jgi:hypothetical protein